MTVRRNHQLSRGIILCAILFGFGLRIYDLGADSLWNDEAGQGLAALQPGIVDTLLYIRGHAGAMPLDYIVTRLFIQISSDEFVIRFPALFWSTASIALVAALAKQVGGQSIAAISAWFTAAAPQLVYYAQEARPYAALLFFSLLATFLLLHALTQGGTSRWLLWGLMTVIGAYFHIYVLLTAAYGGIFILFSMFSHDHADRRQPVRQLITFMIWTGIVLLFILPGYLFFVSNDEYQYELFQYGGNFWSITTAGLGWSFEIYPFQSALLILLTLIGMGGIVIQQRRDARFLVLLFGLLCVVVAIFVIDAIKGYWYIPRQIHHLQPIILIFAATGCWWIGSKVAHWIPSATHYFSAIQSATAAILVLTTLLLGRQILIDTYTYPKGNAREIMVLLLSSSEEISAIYVEPTYEMKLYLFYTMILSGNDNRLQARLRPVIWEEIVAPAREPDHQYLIAPPMFIEPKTAQLRSAGYYSILEPSTDEGWDRSIWGRP